MKKNSQGNIRALLPSTPEPQPLDSAGSISGALSCGVDAGWCLPNSMQGVDTVSLLSSLDEQLEDVTREGLFLGKYTFIDLSKRRRGGVSLLLLSVALGSCLRVNSIIVRGTHRTILLTIRELCICPFDFPDKPCIYQVSCSTSAGQTAAQPQTPRKLNCFHQSFSIRLFVPQFVYGFCWPSSSSA
jgi:hypothetical protein